MQYQAVKSSTRTALGRTLLVAGLLAAVAGCRRDDHLITGSVPSDGYKTRHPIVLAEVPIALDVPVGPNSTGLSPRMADRIRAFVIKSRRDGNGSLQVLVPAGSANEVAAARVAADIRRTAEGAGLPAHRISTRGYRVDAKGAIAPVRLSYREMKAVVHQCGLWQDDLTSGFSNEQDSEFGCATQNNLAAMLEDPADLLYPRTGEPSDPMRRNDVFEKYRKGEPAATSYDAGEALAEVGGE